ncbi:uncharacterized protein GGS22DRAFT_194718 [Annulohypoxylon maeteangense]|uniref:uncharacterized protein n=1 Tax=Annulohypoxylon maeteangense TaxID=1927788 RepID=UPI002008E473|nr:uncharacterized protein GGS22DRAFT_194718 [Annulohypoxylon maeteangense]KAI0884109.1 hypothetical protein GGS22DRAFT_194718 [Annulohypoxylon maeteangense]
MSPQLPSFASQSKPTERAETLKSVGRLRSACDSCHQAKIRCSGGNPCLTCLVSQAKCSYSPGNRLGRPKGSKNKRVAVEKNKDKRDETAESKHTNGAVDRRGSEPSARGEAQQHSGFMPAEFDLEHGFHAGITEDLLNSNFASFIDTIGESHAHTSLEGDLSATFPRPSNARDQSPYQSLAFGTPSSAYDSEYTTATINSYAEETELHTPRSTVSLDDKHEYLGIGSFVPQKPTHCPCLQQQVQLVYQLGDIQCSNAGTPTVDSVLRGVQLAQVPWKDMMECRWCQRKEDQKEGFLLFATSIRILLSLFQKLNSTSHKNDIVSETTMNQAFPFALDVEVSVGNFKLIGGAKEEVIGVVVRRALQSVTTALLYLWERVDRPRLSPSADQRGGGGTDATPGSSDSQERRRSDFPPNFGTQDIGALLTSLYSIMQAIKRDL